jgi:hypothetical protein
VTGVGDAAVDPVDVDPRLEDPLPVDAAPVDADAAAAAARRFAAASRFADAVALAVPWLIEPEAFVTAAWLVATAGSLPAAIRV